MSELRMEAVMTPCPYKVEARAGLNDALQIMAFRGVRHLPVHEHGELVGVLNARDGELVRALLEMPEVTAGEVCSRDPYIIRTNDLVKDVARDMAAKRVECALVVDEEENLAGIFTTTDALKVIGLLVK